MPSAFETSALHWEASDHMEGRMVRSLSMNSSGWVEAFQRVVEWAGAMLHVASVAVFCYKLCSSAGHNGCKVFWDLRDLFSSVSPGSRHRMPGKEICCPWERSSKCPARWQKVENTDAVTQFVLVFVVRCVAQKKKLVPRAKSVTWPDWDLGSAAQHVIPVRVGIERDHL